MLSLFSIKKLFIRKKSKDSSVGSNITSEVVSIISEQTGKTRKYINAQFIYLPLKHC